MALAFEARSGSEWLADLPSRGRLVKVEHGCSTLKAPVPYLCASEPQPAHQIIRTDASSLLQKELLDRRRRQASNNQNSGANEQEMSRKRPNDDPVNSSGEQSQKRSRLGEAAGGCPDQSNSSQTNYTLEQLRRKTVVEIRDILRLKNLPVTGRKEELISRLIAQQRRGARATAFSSFAHPK
eukprot:evm.model.scf_1509.2 EVM.evm.TU.scf_1509.2   scf_1509:5608-8423(-)